MQTTEEVNLNEQGKCQELELEGDAAPKELELSPAEAVFSDIVLNMADMLFSDYFRYFPDVAEELKEILNIYPEREKDLTYRDIAVHISYFLEINQYQKYLDALYLLAEPLRACYEERIEVCSKNKVPLARHLEVLEKEKNYPKAWGMTVAEFFIGLDGAGKRYGKVPNFYDVYVDKIERYDNPDESYWLACFVHMTAAFGKEDETELLNYILVEPYTLI